MTCSLCSNERKIIYKKINLNREKNYYAQKQLQLQLYKPDPRTNLLHTEAPRPKCGSDIETGGVRLRNDDRRCHAKAMSLQVFTGGSSERPPRRARRMRIKILMHVHRTLSLSRRKQSCAIDFVDQISEYAGNDLN